MADIEYKSSNATVLFLFFLLLCLIVLLIFLYKKLNKESEGKYTIRRMVYKEGGLRDQVRGAATFLGERLGVQLWPNSESEEDGEEMQEIQDEEGQMGGHSSQGFDSEEGEEDEEDFGERNGKRGDTSDENSSFGDPEERVGLMDELEVKGETEEKEGDGDGKGEASGGAGLQITLSQFSGSANWSGAEGGVSDVTAL